MDPKIKMLLLYSLGAVHNLEKYCSIDNSYYNTFFNITM